jgi:hypothetical protein
MVKFNLWRTYPPQTHYLEIGGKDDGAGLAGFTHNFHQEKLSLQGSLTDGCLVDLFNNGNRGAAAGLAEALYVDELWVPIGATLNLNNLHLCTMRGISPHWVTVADSGATCSGAAPSSTSLPRSPASSGSWAPASWVCWAGAAARTDPGGGQPLIIDLRKRGGPPPFLINYTKACCITGDGRH